MRINYKTKFLLAPWNGSPVKEETRQEWIHQMIDWLKRHPDEKDTSVLSGDSLVTVYRQENCFEIMDCFVRSNIDVPLDIAVQPQEPWRDNDYPDGDD